MQGKKIIARGAADSKNNVVACIKAAESYLETSHKVPLNLKFIFEGEEEIGSPHLPGFIEENRERLKADSVVCYDGDLDETGRAEINLGVKGLLYVELRCKTAKDDLHSSYAPIVPNAAWRLAWALSTIKSQEEKILVKGWYDDVEPFTPAQSRLIPKLPFRGENLLKEFGLKRFLKANTNKEALKRYLMEPTCTICGFKTGSLEPSRTKPSAPIAKAAARAARIVFGSNPVIVPRNPASGPDYLFTKRLGMDSIWTGGALPSAYSHAHAPNEYTTVDQFLNGIKYMAAIIDSYAKIQ